jgi:D-alanyl-D-alanine dipeptidase
MHRAFCAFLFLVCAISTETDAASHERDRSRQCLLVLTEKWTSTSGLLRAFTRPDASEVWKEEGEEIPVMLGKNGLGSGRGLTHLEFEGAPEKKEGDNKAPAGVFHLISAFGYAPAQSASWVKLRYLPLTNKIEGIDDPKSRYYNRLVDRSKVAKVDWASSERMRRDDDLYKWGIVVDHNSAATPGGGSCIFLHIWKTPSTPTTGCTAMSEQNLIRLLRWLDPERDPILIQMPRSDYRSMRASYAWPEVAL